MSLRAERHYYSWMEYAQRMVDNPRTTRICMGNLPRLFDQVAGALQYRKPMLWIECLHVRRLLWDRVLAFLPR